MSIGNPSRFRAIPLGDLYLSHEIARRRYGCRGVKRIFSTELRGSRMTAMTYQGEDAEQQWREEVSRYSQIRHPNIAQLFGVVHSGLRAAVFHGEMVPYKEVLQTFGSSHFLSVYVWACMTTEFKEVDQYLADVHKRHLVRKSHAQYSLPISLIAQHWTDYTLWLRPGSLSLCLDLSEATSYVPLYLADVRPQRRLEHLRPPRTSEIISSLPHQDYHTICFWYLCRFGQFSGPSTTEIRVGSISYMPAGSKYEDFGERIGFFPQVEVRDHGWQEPKLWGPGMDTLVTNGTTIVLLENGWTRVDSAQVDYFYRRRISVEPRYARSWLAHANEIFDSHNITSGFEDYFLTDVLNLWVELSGDVTNMPSGYLFLCPLSTIRDDGPASFRVRLDAPPVYWSFDATGNDRLTVEEAQSLGFPAIRAEIEVWGKFWDESVYGGIAEFQRSNYFDPHDCETEYPRLDVCSDRADFASPKLLEPPKMCLVEEDEDDLDSSIHVPWCDLEDNLAPPTGLNVVVSVQIFLILLCIPLSL